MHLRLIHPRNRQADGNSTIEHRQNRYWLESSPKILRPTLGKAVIDPSKELFCQGQVTLFVLGSQPLQITKCYHLSAVFTDKTAYANAINSGFEVEDGSSWAARLLVKAGYAEVVSEAAITGAN